MNKRNRWIAAAAILLVLTVVFIWEGRGTSQPLEPQVGMGEAGGPSDLTAPMTDAAQHEGADEAAAGADMTTLVADADPQATAGAGAGLEAAERQGTEVSVAAETAGAEDDTPPASDTASDEAAGDPAAPSIADGKAPASSGGPAPDSSNGTPRQPAAAKPPAQPTPSQESPPAGSKDKYQTDPVPEGKAQPVEWQDAKVDKSKALTATLSVSAETLLTRLDRFNPDKLEVLPEDGIIYKAQQVNFYEGESVFDLLLREMRKNSIHMEFVMTPLYNSNYVEGINNIYEFDGGELSGWMYKVNGWFPNYGSSRYALQDGDVVEWVYTTDLGRDVGGDGAAGGNGG
ncbi:DUF4430 domain-containing protein [Paenibacillus sp. 1P07SE]|uniref:DUF4430 domain-containing protein n=1 Tax=Paenibacillus sp. 1P07SE TaxID=3132209 RepID=UPI0039A5370C